MRGQEILGVGLIDADKKDCISLFAVQTPNPKTLNTAKWTLVDWYLFALEKKKAELLKLSKYVVADAWFAKSTFCEGVTKLGFYLISRFRDDARLLYPTKQPRERKKGRPKKFDGKVDFSNLDYSRFERLELDLEGECFTAILYSVALNAKVRVVIWMPSCKDSHKVYFSTDTAMTGKDVIEFYKIRFQIEFCFREAKQHAGLCNSQSRNIKSLDFNFNASLTSINVAKAYAARMNKTFSMASIKTMMHNAFLLERFISVSGIRPNTRLNERLFTEVIEFAAIAA